MYPGKWGLECPDKPAVIHALTGETLSHGELNNRSNQLAQLFWDRGLRPGDHTAIFMENNLRFFEVIWAALRSGLYITTVNRYLTDEEAGYIIHDCEAQALITSKHLSAVATALPDHAPNCKTWLMTDGLPENPGHRFEAYESAISEYPPTPLAAQPAGQTMLYSSGTTGRPKGIKRPLTGLMIDDPNTPIGAMQRTLWGFNEDTVYLSPAPLYHSAPIGFCTAALALGGTVVMMPRFDETGALQAIETYRVTHSQWVPTMFTRMLKLEPAQREGFDLSSHKTAVHAAAPCPAGIKQQMFEWWGPILNEYYAGTELNGMTHANPQEWLANPGTVGRPVLGVLHICDEDGMELPVGEPGLVYFELPQMPFSYHNADEKTKAAQHPEHPNWTALRDLA